MSYYHIGGTIRNATHEQIKVAFQKHGLNLEFKARIFGYDLWLTNDTMKLYIKTHDNDELEYNFHLDFYRPSDAFKLLVEQITGLLLAEAIVFSLYYSEKDENGDCVGEETKMFHPDF